MQTSIYHINYKTSIIMSWWIIRNTVMTRERPFPSLVPADPE